MIELIVFVTFFVIFFFQINREMMALIESLQQKAVEEGVDANECGNDSDLEENDGGLANEDDASLNEDEKDRAKDRKTKCQVKNSDVNADDHG